MEKADYRGSERQYVKPLETSAVLNASLTKGRNIWVPVLPQTHFGSVTRLTFSVPLDDSRSYRQLPTLEKPQIHTKKRFMDEVQRKQFLKSKGEEPFFSLFRDEGDEATMKTYEKGSYM